MKKELSSLSSLVYRAASNKNTIPILSGMLIEVDSDRGLTMTATDMDIGIVASTQEVEILEEGKVLVNAHYFNDFIKLLPDGIITIELNLEASKLASITDALRALSIFTEILIIPTCHLKKWKRGWNCLNQF